MIGWISSLLLAVCAIPAAWKAYQTKKCSVSKLFLWIWFFGEIFGIAYAMQLNSLPLLVNYTVNIICIVILIRYNE